LSLLGDEGQTSVPKFAPKGWITGDIFRETEEERQSRLAQKKVTKATVLAGCIATSPEKIKDVQRLESKAQARGVTKTVAKRVNTPPSSPVAPPRRRRRV
jgi:hypothetical protein